MYKTFLTKTILTINHDHLMGGNLAALCMYEFLKNDATIHTTTIYEHELKKSHSVFQISKGGKNADIVVYEDGRVLCKKWLSRGITGLKDLKFCDQLGTLKTNLYDPECFDKIKKFITNS